MPPALMRVGLVALFLLALPPAALASGESTDPDALERALDALQRDRPEDAYALVAGGLKAGDAESMFIAGLLQDIGAGALISRESAGRLLERAAEGGSEAAMRYLAWRHTTGDADGNTDEARAAALRQRLPAEVNIDRRLGRWLTVVDGMCAPRLSLALYWMMDRAGDENPVAEANLATAYLSGGWTAPDLEQHIFWLRRAAEHGEPESMLRLALYIGLGMHGEPDPGKELGLIRSAAEAGSAEAQFTLAEKFLRGREMEGDVAAAADWYRKAALQGHVGAMEKLGDLLRQGGPGLERDYVSALAFSRIAADRGSAEAMADVANMLRQGQGTPQDVAEAARLYEKSAGLGYTHGAYMVGWLAINPPEGVAPDYKKALPWFEKAAAADHGRAMRQIGLFYRDGNGVEKDDAKSFEWFERAAREGDAWSQNRVGWMLRQGVGIETDDEEAVTWFALAAKNGLPIGHGNLAFHYLHGRGTAKDVVRAFEYACLCLQDETEDWVTNTFMRAVQHANPDERKQIVRHLEERIREPAFLEAEGSLPEVALVLLERGPAEVRDAALAKELLARMTESRRTASLPVIAWRHYTGVGVPLDIATARQRAREAVEAGVEGAIFVQANIESIAGESQEERDRARSVLHKLADSGDARAARLLAQRKLAGIGEEIDPEGARRLLRIAFRVKEGESDSVFERVFEYTSGRPKPPPSDAEFEALKAAVAFAEERHPVPVHSTTPAYPFDLVESDIQGHATIRMVVSAEGVPGNVQSVEASHPLFAAAGVGAMRLWRFAPGIKGGVPVAVNVQQTLRFALNDRERDAKVEGDQVP